MYARTLLSKRHGNRLVPYAVLFAALATLAVAQDKPAEPATASEAIKADIADLAWISGAWKGDGLGGKVEEHWTAPAGGAMLGMFRLVSGQGRATVFELCLIEQVEEHIVYRFRHFGPQHKPWEPPDQPLTFHLTRLTEYEAVFECQGEQDPKRLTYRRVGDKLAIRVQAVKDGRLDEGFEVRMQKATLGD